MTRVLRSAVVGARGVGGAHIAALRTLPGVEVVAIAGSSAGSAREMADRHAVTAFTSDFGDLVGEPDIDVIHVCTPNDSHAVMAAAALAAGKHVVCEKPLAINTEQAAHLVEGAAASTALSVVAYNYRYLPLVGMLRDLVLEERLGRVHAIRGSYLQNWMLSDQANWRTDPSRGGISPVLADIGTHLIDLAEVVTGTVITDAFADFGVAEHVGSGRDQVNLLLRMSNGAAVTLALSQVSPAHTNLLTLEVDGDRGSALWSFDGREVLRIIDAGAMAEVSVDKHVAGSGGGQYWVNQSPADTALRGLLEATYAAIRAGIYPGAATPAPAGQMPLPRFADGLRHVQVTDTACLDFSSSSLRPIGPAGADAPVPAAPIVDLASQVGR